MKHKFLKFSAASVAALHGINTFIDSNVQHAPGSGDGEYYHWENGDIFYKKAGEGEPLLLLHDINVFSSGNEWSQVIGKLSKDHTVYVPDLIGCGHSGKPSGTYTTYLYVQMLTKFIKNVIEGKPKVVTSGLSSIPTIMADAMDENLLGSIKMINPPSISSLKPGPDDLSRLYVYFSEIPVIGRSCYYAAVNRTNTEDYLTEKCFYNPFALKQNTVKAAYEAAHLGEGGGRYLLASLNGNYLNTDISSALQHTNKQITIFLSESADANDIAAEYQALNDHLEVKTFPETGKMPQLERPDLVCDAI